MSELAILVPVLERPHRVRPLLESIASTVPDGTRVVFVCDVKDYDEQRTIHASLTDCRFGPLEVTVLRHGGGYPEKINVAVERTDEPLLFLAADDLNFEDGWFEAAKAYLCDETVGVVGVNDLIDRPHRPRHATHFLMTRSYAQEPTIDGQFGPLHTGYRGWFCDDELIGTAMHRGCYVYAEDSHVEHLHVMNSKSLDDSTYRKGREFAPLDRRLFRRRQALWT